MKQLYLLTRDLHLYFGLFISPLLIVFSLSVFFLVHAHIPGTGAAPAVRTVSDVTLPTGLDTLSGRVQVDALRPILDALDVHGEINFVRRIAKENRLVVPVIVPGREVSVDLNLAAHRATITERTTGLWSAMVFLHKMPGQHNAALRGNWVWMRLWRVLTDATVYLILFISVSGVYLWAVLRAERRIGLILLSAGAISFLGFTCAIVR